jgi:CRISPR-associated protein GSU0053 (Cas_GSU0053)
MNIDRDFLDIDYINTKVNVTFKPNGLLNASTFPNVGQIIYEGESIDRLTLDSPASVTNMLESTIFRGKPDPPIFANLPHIRIINASGKFIGSSILLANRLGDGYLMKNSSALLEGERFSKRIAREVEQNGLAATVLYYCPMTLLHGSWFSPLGRGASIAKSIAGGSLNAINVREALVGGLHRDQLWGDVQNLDLADFDRANKPSELGIGNIPHSTRRYYCERVEGYFEISRSRIYGYEIPESGKHLIEGLAVYELLQFLEVVPMHRVDCSIEVSKIEKNQGFTIGSQEINTALAARIEVEKSLERCLQEQIIGPVRTITLDLRPKDSVSTPKPSTRKKTHNADNLNSSQ